MAVLACTGLSIYFHGVKHYRYSMLRYLFRFDQVRAYAFDPKYRRLVDLLADQHNPEDRFATVWDSNTGALLSRRMYPDATA